MGHASGSDNSDFERWRRDILEGTPAKRIQVAADKGLLNSLEVSPGEIFILGGHPGSGKTALAQQLMFDALSQPGQDELTAMVCNVEMPVGALLDRELARLSGVPFSQIRRKEFTDAAMREASLRYAD